MRIVPFAALIAACGGAAKEPTAWRQRPAFHIDSADDVRWPATRTLFVGTVHQEQHVALLELDDDPAGPTPRPPLIALHGASVSELADGARAALSGVGRHVERDEAAHGAVISIDDVLLEPDLAAPRVSAYPLLRHDADLSIALAATYVTSEGIVRERDGRFLLQLPSDENLQLWVTACDGEANARAQVGKHRRVYGRLVAERDEHAPPDVLPTMGVGFPAFECLCACRDMTARCTSSSSSFSSSRSAARTASSASRQARRPQATRSSIG
jgi:hypothetical protein